MDSIVLSRGTNELCDWELDGGFGATICTMVSVLLAFWLDEDRLTQFCSASTSICFPRTSVAFFMIYKLTRKMKINYKHTKKMKQICLSTEQIGRVKLKRTPTYEHYITRKTGMDPPPPTVQAQKDPP